MKDELTGLLDKEAFKLLVEHELSVAPRSGRVDTLLVIDVDDLQSVDSAVGHDETLCEIARLLQRTARESDVIARIGDNEFAIFALDCVGDALAQRILMSLVRVGAGGGPSRRQWAVRVNVGITEVGAGGGPSGRQWSVRVKVGITEVRAGEQFDDLITRAGPAAFLRAEQR